MNDKKQSESAVDVKALLEEVGKLRLQCGGMELDINQLRAANARLTEERNAMNAMCDALHKAARIAGMSPGDDTLHLPDFITKMIEDRKLTHVSREHALSVGESLSQSIAAQAQYIAMLRANLAPFAELASAFDGHPNDGTIHAWHLPHGDFELTVGQLRKAREAMTAGMETSIPVNIASPTYDSFAMGCGLEDLDITDRYEAMQYGFNQAVTKFEEAIAAEGPLYSHAAQMVKPALPDNPTYGQAVIAALIDGDADADMQRQAAHWLSSRDVGQPVAHPEWAKYDADVLVNYLNGCTNFNGDLVGEMIRFAQRAKQPAELRQLLEKIAERGIPEENYMNFCPACGSSRSAILELRKHLAEEK